MESNIEKLKRNFKEGTFFKNVPISIRNRIVKSINSSNLHYFLSKGRVMTKKYQSDIRKIGTNGVKLGNYYIHKDVSITKESIVYSLGILNEISFDLSIREKYKCKIFMYDPTPISIEYMKAYESDEFFNFYPIGVWVENKILRFYTPKIGGSASLMSDKKNEVTYFDAKCLTMEAIMRQNKHDHISIFKADIEGAALPILSQMVNQKIFPDQIVVELERPKSDMTKIEEYFIEVSKLRSKLKENGYDEFLLPKSKAKYNSLEMLFVKQGKIL